MYCKNCAYDLRGSVAGAAHLDGRKCPECGQNFTAGNSETFDDKPWGGRARGWRLVLLIIIFTLAVLGVSFWGLMMSLAVLSPSVVQHPSFGLAALIWGATSCVDSLLIYAAYCRVNGKQMWRKRDAGGGM